MASTTKTSIPKSCTLPPNKYFRSTRLSPRLVPCSPLLLRSVTSMEFTSQVSLERSCSHAIVLRRQSSAVLILTWSLYFHSFLLHLNLVGNVTLQPARLGKHQEYAKEKLGTDNAKPIFLVMHGGSGSTDDEIKLAVENGVVKMNIDTYVNHSRDLY